jgi:hypothetical protein
MGISELAARVISSTIDKREVLGLSYSSYSGFSRYGREGTAVFRCCDWIK